MPVLREVLHEPIDGSFAGNSKSCDIGIEVATWNQHEALWLECPLVSVKFQIGHGQTVVGGDDHQKWRRRNAAYPYARFVGTRCERRPERDGIRPIGPTKILGVEGNRIGRTVCCGCARIGADYSLQSWRISTVLRAQVIGQRRKKTGQSIRR